MSWKLYEVEGPFNRIKAVIEASVEDILLTSTAGVVELVVEFKHRGSSVRTRVRLPEKVQGLNGALYDSYKEGDFMPSGLIGGGFTL
ncbi:hypothetical protein [Verrucomicrobium spinosum]|nr:hypothetical protein [Verrucomicrobium spinosum]